MTPIVCRFCGSALKHDFADLGMSPLANSFLSAAQLDQMEPFYPLHAHVCSSCFLVQLEEFETPERIFTDYAYFSSWSDTWLDHARRYSEAMVDRFGLGPKNLVVEIASNDGYLLRHLAERGIAVLGIEPAKNVAEAAEAAGVPTLVAFFGTRTARELVERAHHADLLIANNVLAHVPDLNDFVKGMAILLAPRGVATLEFPHLMRLIEHNQFDTIYHEHFSYFSLLTVQKVFAAHGLSVFDVDELPTHGGSLRVYARHAKTAPSEPLESVDALLSRERERGLDRIETYAAFQEQVCATKRELLGFLLEAKRAGRSVVGYGAPAKGNTLLNYCGIRGDFLDYTVDRSPHKQRLFLPGTHIPIHAPERIRETRPDFLLVLPWNLFDEITAQMADIRAWGGRFVRAIPHLEVSD